MPFQVMPGAIPTSHAPSISKAQAIAQTINSATPPPPTPATTRNTAVAGLAALVTPTQANTQHPPAFTEAGNFTLNNSTAPIANQIPDANIAIPPMSPSIPQQRDYSSGLMRSGILQGRFRESRAQPEPIHNPQRAKAIKTTNQNLQTAGNLNQNIGKALKDMAKGEVNPIQLYGDTLNIIGSFINGIPAGIQEARLKSIAQQMKLIEEKKRAINLKMDRVGDDFIASEHKPPLANTDVFNTLVPKPETKSKNTVPAPTTTPAPSKPEPADTAIDQLLKSNASLDQKLDAIEKTLDKMLEKLIKMEKNLEAIQTSLESNTHNPIPNPEDMVVETEAKTEVEIVANNPMAEVPVRTEIETDIIAEARTETEAAEEVEVPEITVDSTPDIDCQMADLISSYEGDIDQLNHRLKVHKLQINLSEDRQRLSISEVYSGVTSSVFEAKADSEGWKILSEINDSAKLDILERFVEAEEEVLANATQQPEPTPEPGKVANNEPSLFL